MKYFIVFLLFIGTVSHIFAQHQDLSEKPNIWNNISSKRDSSIILNAFKFGQINGHFRYFFSLTDNAKTLRDYYAEAIGGGLRFESAQFYNFNIAVSGFYIFPLKSANLFEKDAITGQGNRYEIGLFDVNAIDQLEEINRLEEFFVQYNLKKGFVKFGRQLLNTPFINLQDGRMRPTAVQGFWTEYKLNTSHQLSGGWINAIAPRSTKDWFSNAESIGLYSVGVDISGKKSAYKGQVASDWVGMFNYKYAKDKNFQFDVWYMYTENISHTLLAQWEKKLTSRWKGLYYGVQVASQWKSGNGGNIDPTLAYNQNNRPVYIFGAQIGYKKGGFNQSLSINRINSGGKYLMPREWGRDYFYTFMPRERNEGFGDTKSAVYKIQYLKPKKFQTTLSVGYFSMPDVKNFALNKYGLPTYGQLNVDFRYYFKGALSGLESQALYVYKKNIGDTYDDSKYIFNKTDVHLFNLVLNFKF